MKGKIQRVAVECFGFPTHDQLARLKQTYLFVRGFNFRIDVTHFIGQNTDFWFHCVYPPTAICCRCNCLLPLLLEVSYYQWNVVHQEFQSKRTAQECPSLRARKCSTGRSETNYSNSSFESFLQKSYYRRTWYSNVQRILSIGQLTGLRILKVATRISGHQSHGKRQKGWKQPISQDSKIRLVNPGNAVSLILSGNKNE